MQCAIKATDEKVVCVYHSFFRETRVYLTVADTFKFESMQLCTRKHFSAIYICIIWKEGMDIYANVLFLINCCVNRVKANFEKYNSSWCDLYFSFLRSILIDFIYRFAESKKVFPFYRQKKFYWRGKKSIVKTPS